MHTFFLVVKKNSWTQLAVDSDIKTMLDLDIKWFYLKIDHRPVCLISKT